VRKRIDEAHLDSITAAVFTKDSLKLITAGSDYLVVFWQVPTLSVLFELREHLGPLVSLSTIDERDHTGLLEEHVISIDEEGYML